MIVEDITNEDPFRKVEYLLEEIQKYSSQKVVICFVLSKSDLKDENENLTNKKINQFKNFSKNYEYSVFCIVSSKTGENVNQLFQEIMKSFLLKNDYLYYQHVWEPNKESTFLWGKEFEKVILVMLLIRKQKLKNFPKPIIFKILSQLTEFYVLEKRVPWITLKDKKETKKEEPNNYFCNIN